MQLGTASFLPRDIDADLDHWLEPFLDATGRSTRRKMAPLYVRGLLGSGGRKSVQPMAERLGLSSHDPLHHFISSPAWDDAPLWRVLAEQVDRQVGGAGAVLVVDDSGLPKKGALSVGVARQYCGELGKVANSQVLVTLTLARGEVPLPVGLRLFLPTAWTEDAERCDEAGVAEAARTAQTKPEIALAEIDRVRAAGLRFSCVLADGGFGSSPVFRHGLDEREPSAGRCHLNIHMRVGIEDDRVGARLIEDDRPHDHRNRRHGGGVQCRGNRGLRAECSLDSRHAGGDVGRGAGVDVHGE